MQSLNIDNKKTYSKNVISDDIYVFEISVIKKNNQVETIRKIKNKKMDNLLTIEDAIKYDNIEKIQIKAVNINNPKMSYNVKFKVKNTSKFINYKKIKISLSKVTLGFIELSYQLIN